MATPVSLIYLDVDDEITSAANRIRNVTEMRVALVLPAGSRLATSRMNFRLLAREAQSHAHDLFIVAPEAATRALAASAGLAVYPTVRDLEEAMGDGDGDVGEAGPAAAGAGALTAPLDVVAPPDRGARPRGDMARPLGERGPSPGAPPAGMPRSDRGGLLGRSAAADLPVVSGARRRTERPRAWVIVLVAIVVVAFVGGFVGAQFLPAATIVVTPKVEPISLTFNVTADPTATSADLAAGVVPATRPDIPLEATDDFPATGKKVTETKATGTVTFSSTRHGRFEHDPGRQHRRHPVEQPVRDPADRHPAAGDSGRRVPNITVVPSTGNSTVTAVKPGTGGNVAAGAIKIVPPDENSSSSSGSRTRRRRRAAPIPRRSIVSQKDLDKALAALTSQLDDELEQIVTEPGQILPDVTIFAETKSRTAAEPSRRSQDAPRRPGRDASRSP